MARLRARLTSASALSSAAVVVATGALVAAALGAEGYHTPELELHDAGIWLSRSDEGALGRLNTQVKEVDVRIDLGIGVFELLQHDGVVWVHDAAGALCVVDGRTAKVTASVALPAADAAVSLGGTPGGPATGAVLAGDDLWVQPAADLLGMGLPPASSCQRGSGDTEDTEDTPAEPAELEAAEPDQVIPGAATVAVDIEGTAWVLVPGDGVVRSFDASGAPVGEEELPEVAEDHELQLSVVGATPVVLDLTEPAILLPGHDPIPLDPDIGSSPQLQQTGPASDVVLVGTDAGLVEIPLDGGDPALTVDGGSADPARPVWLDGCAYVAWSGAPSYAVACVGRDVDRGPLGAEAQGKPLRIRTNRGKVAINELQSGYAFLLGDGTPDPINWDDAVVDPRDDTDDDAESTTQRPQDAEEQAPPVAVDDTGDDAFATRPGHAVVVHPMRNDHDPNKDDVLVIESVEDIGGCECLELVDGGLSVQVTPPGSTVEDIRFRYTINDGQDAASAESVVEIHDETVNGPPVLTEDQTTTVASGGTVKHNVLADARDPDGDPMSLVVPVEPPAADGSQGTVTASVDGVVAFSAPGGTDLEPFTGTVTVPFTITDGRDGGTLSAELTVTVVSPDETHAPEARGDHAQTVVGHEVVVDVLANDSDADGDPLRVSHPGSSDTATVTKDDRNRIHVVPTVPGPLVLTYTVTDGRTAEVAAKLRIDVLEEDGPRPPTAVRDDIVLPLGQVAVADVVLNDSDPNGDVLIVEGVSGAEEAGLAVEVIEHRFLRVRATRALDRAAVFTYSVTDGTAGDTAAVVVRPGPPAEPQPPTANDDGYRVRAGAIAALDVLANDTDPEGALLHLRSVEAPPGFESHVFVQDGKLRFAAPSDPPPTPIRLSYTASDDENPMIGRTDSAEVLVTVVPDDDVNGAPAPHELTARTVAGVPVVIQVPVATIDPDGDDVTLLGLADTPDAAPRHGSVVEVGNDRLTYVSDRWDAGFYGTDTFSYVVRDAKGLEAVATVRVGVAAPAARNHPPVAIEDVRQASGTSLTIDVLRNDSDPDDDPLTLVDGSLSVPDGAPYAVGATDDGRVRFDPRGMQPGEVASFGYEVTDGILTSAGRVTVTITDLQPVAPVALDDRHPATLAGEQVEIDVLANDVDPDGARADLQIASADGTPAIEVVEGLAEPPPATNPVRFTMPAADLVLRYRVLDGDGQEAEAIVRVRHAAADVVFPPTARHDEATTGEGEPVVVDVLGNDTVMPGRTPQLLQVTARENGTCAATPDGEVRFEPAPGFAGRGGCAYLLGDGPGDSPDTLRASGTVGVVVERTRNALPRFVEQTVTLYANSERTIDLRSGVIDEDDPEQRQQVTLGEPTGATNGVSASISGTELRLRASANATAGEVRLSFTVSDGTDESAAPGVVIVRVSQFDGKLAALTGDTVETFQRQAAPPLDVLANDTRAIDDQPLTIIAVSQPPAGEGSVEFDPSGEVRFTPAGDFHGVTSFTYTVNDGTDLPERYQTAAATVTVVGFPDPPAPPSLERLDQAVALTWSAPADNGAPITSYVIETSDGRREQTTATSHTFRGLTNGQAYTFRIAAVNRANTETGTEGAFSVPSKSIKPDAVPDTPGAPTASFVASGSAIDVSWVAPSANGSAIDRFVVRVDPAPAGRPALVEVGPAPTSLRVDGLTNGVAYTFAVQAWKTVADDTGTVQLSSGFSPSSVPEIPAAPPDAPTKPTVNAADLGDGNITVRWTEPASNGDAIASYHVEYLVDGARVGVQTVPGSARQTTIQGTDNNKKYTFRVAAENKAGTGAASPESDAVNSFGVPGPVAAISATEGDGSSVLTFTRPPENGAAIDSYQYRANGGPWTGAAHSTSGATVTMNVGGLTNGTTYQFQVRAHNARDWATDPGASSNTVRPYGAPFAPGGLTGSQGSTTLTWSWGAAGLNGHDGISRYEVSVNGGGFASVGGATSYQTNVAPGECRTLVARGIGNRTGDGREVGSQTGAVQACAPAPPPPQPAVSLSQGGSAAGQPGCSSAGCSYLTISWSNLPNTVHRFECLESNGTPFYDSNGRNPPRPSGPSGTMQLVCYADASVYGGVSVRLDGTWTSNLANW